MTTYRLTHLPSGEAHTIEADNALELLIGIAGTPFVTTYPDMSVPVRPLFSTRNHLVERISAGDACVERGNWRLEEARA